MNNMMIYIFCILDLTPGHTEDGSKILNEFSLLHSKCEKHYFLFQLKNFLWFCILLFPRCVDQETGCCLLPHIVILHMNLTLRINVLPLQKIMIIENQYTLQTANNISKCIIVVNKFLILSEILYQIATYTIYIHLYSFSNQSETVLGGIQSAGVITKTLI